MTWTAPRRLAVGGVKGLVIGRLLFQGEGTTHPLLSQSTVYRKGKSQPRRASRDLPRAAPSSTQLIDEPKEEAGPYTSSPRPRRLRQRSRKLLSDETERRAYLARLEDAITQFPR